MAGCHGSGRTLTQVTDTSDSVRPRARKRPSSGSLWSPRFKRAPIAADPSPAAAALVLAGAKRRAEAPAFGQRGRGWLMRRLLAGADLAGLMGAALLTEALFGNRGTEQLALLPELALFALTLPLWLLGVAAFGLYGRDEERANHSSADDLLRIFLLVTVAVWVLSQGTLLLGVLEPEPLKITAFWIAAVLGMSCARVAVRGFARRSPTYRQRTIVVGAGNVGQLVARKLLMHPEYGIDLVGLVDSAPRPLSRWLAARTSLIGRTEDIDQVVEYLKVERVVFAFTEASHHENLACIRRLRDRGVQVDLVPRYFEVMGPRVDVHDIEGLELVGLPPVRPARSSRLVKRTIDVAVSSLAIVVLAPVFAVVSLLVRGSSPGPIFFRQERLGEGMRPFTLLKFRTMRTDTDDAEHREFIASSMTVEDATGLLQEKGAFKLDRSSAVTRVGARLRSLSLDELPQLFNILRGDMSLVGPRPCLRWETEHFADHHFDRFQVPAGLTGLWQVSARAQATFREALDLDILYVQSASIGLDLRLLLRTPLQLLRSKATA